VTDQGNGARNQEEFGGEGEKEGGGDIGLILQQRKEKRNGEKRGILRSVE